MGTRLTDFYSSPRPITLATANIQDLDSIKTTIATVAAAVTYSGAALNGDDVASNVAYPLHAHKPSGQMPEMGIPMYPCATASSSAGSYINGTTVVFTGTYGGVPATSTATVVGTDGNATFVGDKPLESVSSVTIGPQNDTSGAWTLGFQDIGPWLEGGEYNVVRSIRASDAGNIATQDQAGHIDVTPFAAEEPQPIAPWRINYANTTVTGFTLYR